MISYTILPAISIMQTLYKLTIQTFQEKSNNKGMVMEKGQKQITSLN